MANIRPLCPALAERARVELNEKPNEIEARINELREWIVQQPHLKARTGESSACNDQSNHHTIDPILSFSLDVCLTSMFLCRRSVSGVVFTRQQIRYESGQAKN